ncbi:hypothetical protein AKJ16_DCAP05088 [Drosera capensis]
MPAALLGSLTAAFHFGSAAASNSTDQLKTGGLRFGFVGSPASEVWSQRHDNESANDYSITLSFREAIEVHGHGFKMMTTEDAVLSDYLEFGKVPQLGLTKGCQGGEGSKGFVGSNCMENAKELWESFEKKYKMEDVGHKKFIVEKGSFDFKMVDSKIVEFKNYLKHKHKEMKFEDLIIILRIDEDNL